MKIFWDLDGTLANNEHRHHLLPKTGQGDKTAHWTAFNQACVDDTVIQSTYFLFMSLSQNFATYIVTGRAEDSRSQTMEWLEKNGMGHYYQLHMRPVEDHRRAKEFKLDKFMELGLADGDVVFEDDHQVIKMLREFFPGVIICEVPSGCIAVQMGRSNNELQVDTSSEADSFVMQRCTKNV